MYADYAGIHTATAYVDAEYPLNSSLDVLTNEYMVNNTVYMGGAAFFSEVEEIIGEEAVQKVLRTLYQEYGYRILNTQAVLDSFRSATTNQLEYMNDLINRYFFSYHGSLE